MRTFVCGLQSWYSESLTYDLISQTSPGGLPPRPLKPASGTIGVTAILNNNLSHSPSSLGRRLLRSTRRCFEALRVLGVASSHLRF